MPAHLVAFEALFVPSARSLCKRGGAGNVTSRNKISARLFARAGKCGEMVFPWPCDEMLAAPVWRCHVYRIALAIVILAVAGMLAAEHAAAQSPPRTSGGPSASHVPPPKGSPGERVPDVPSSLGGQVQSNLNRLEDELRINAGQQKAWDAYATRVTRLADDVARARFAMRDLEGAAITAPQLFDRIAESAQNRLTAVEDIIEAGRALYDKLSAEQQKLADRRLALIALSLVSGVPPPGAKNP